MSVLVSKESVRPVESAIQTYLNSRQAAVEFLLDYLNPDGSIGPVEQGIFYYRVPWIFAITGETTAAMKLTHWIRQNMLSAEGEFVGDASPDLGANYQANTYAETCLAYGAHLLRQYDVSEAAIHFAIKYQDPETGGVFMDRRATNAHAPQLLYLTSQFGMSALVTGYRREAIMAGEWLQRLWDAQPELPNRLYSIWTRAGGLATDVPEGGDRRHYIHESQDVRQMHYNGGIAAAFLARLHISTGDRKWLDLAREYQAFSMNSTERQFEVMQVCKSGWGSSLLYLITGDKEYLDWTLKMGDWFVANQHGDGHWENSKYISPDAPLHSNLGCTAEFINHMDCIAGALAARSIR